MKTYSRIKTWTKGVQTWKVEPRQWRWQRDLPAQREPTSRSVLPATWWGQHWCKSQQHPHSTPDLAVLCLTLSSAVHSPWRDQRTLLEALVAATHTEYPSTLTIWHSQADKGPCIHKSLPSLQCFLIAWLLNLQFAKLPFFPTNTNSKYFKSIELNLVFGSTIAKTIFSVHFRLQQKQLRTTWSFRNNFYPRLPPCSSGHHIRLIYLKNFWVVNTLSSLSLQHVRGTTRINQLSFLHMNQ